MRKLLDEGRSVHEPTDEGESLLSLACSAGRTFMPHIFHHADKIFLSFCISVFFNASIDISNILRVWYLAHANDFYICNCTVKKIFTYTCSDKIKKE